MRFPGVTLLVAASLLAGCSDASGPSGVPSDGAPFGEGVPVGTLRVLVVDDALLPIEDASVIVPGLVDGVTDATGALETPLPVGDHHAFVSAPGYHEHEGSLQVHEGQVTELAVTLYSAALDLPYRETFTGTGLVFCGIAWRDPVTQNDYDSSGNPCVAASWPSSGAGGLIQPVPGTEALDYSLLRFPLGLVNASGMWVETEWTASSGLSRGMDVIWAFLEDAVAIPIEVAGGPTSPISVRVPIERMDEVKANNTQVTCTPDACDVWSFHYLRGQLLGADAAPADAGVAFQQRFTDWVTVFHNGPLPQAFTILEDA